MQEHEGRREHADRTGDGACRRWLGRAAGLVVAGAAAFEAGAQERCGPETVPGRAAAQMQVCVVNRPRYAAELFGPGADAAELGYGRDADAAGLSHPLGNVAESDRGRLRVRDINPLILQ